MRTYLLHTVDLKSSCASERQRDEALLTRRCRRMMMQQGRSLDTSNLIYPSPADVSATRCQASSTSLAAEPHPRVALTQRYACRYWRNRHALLGELYVTCYRTQQRPHNNLPCKLRWLNAMPADTRRSYVTDYSIQIFPFKALLAATYYVSECVC